MNKQRQPILELILKKGFEKVDNFNYGGCYIYTHKKDKKGILYCPKDDKIMFSYHRKVVEEYEDYMK